MTMLDIGKRVKTKGTIKAINGRAEHVDLSFPAATIVSVSDSGQVITVSTGGQFFDVYPEDVELV